ncbi:hypothetical protein KTD33_07840 [Burkholderia gladioli]|uniref:hypothetical protein n=1 Tax=Burkholderia gladioli TaxID=28095 RepID=UPI0016409088|nr:hypothetical protein [Burkholderia gladioli]MBU9194447.1 hypothetical protein [Burkholderia gladioli]MBU9218352.1 hypothetical protein [Burkholderia gladioli]MDN7725962.1 hypothetical protein [Burkholderia gladioli]
MKNDREKLQTLHVSNTANKERIEHAIGNNQMHITSAPLLLPSLLPIPLQRRSLQGNLSAQPTISAAAHASLVGLTDISFLQQVETKGFC